MDYVRRTYIEFLYLDFIFHEKSIQKVNTRDVAKVKVPNNAFGFRFFDILSVVMEIDGKPVNLTSEHINVSPMHYYGGRVYTRAEVEREIPNNQALLSEMKSNYWRRVIKTRAGEFLPFYETDVLIEIT